MYSGVILRFALLCAIGVSFAWVNDYDRPFVFECQNNKPITVFRSRHDNPHEDRLSSFQMNASSALRLLLLCTIGVTFAWVNDYDEPFLFECPVGRPIYWFQSDHEDYYNDRIFDFQCGNYIGEPECVWSDWVNDYDEQFSYPCANNHFVSGIESTHDNYYNDRIFKFYCCEVANFTVLDCSWTPFVNTYDEDFTYVLDESRILCGVGSEHDNYYNDKRFEMYECELPSH